MIESADRLSFFSEYYFSAKLREIRQLQSEGRPIINLGIGSPDMMPDSSIVEALHKSALQPDAHGYQPYQGLPELKQAIKIFHESAYKFDAGQLEVLPLLGSKEGITHISLAYLNPGDQVLVPALGYPTYTSVTRMVNAEPVYYPLLEQENYEPDWQFLEHSDLSRVKIIWLNYPHMPTGTTGGKALLQKFVDFASDNRILLCHDNPYSFIGNDKPTSIFNIPGAEDVAIELGSLSKTFNMAGWRVGWAIGKPELIKPVLQIKSNMDSGMFKPIQEASVKALSLGTDWMKQLNGLYNQRRIQAFHVMDLLKCTYDRNQAGMFVWAKVPDGNGETFADKLLYEFDVFLTPGFIFGREHGDQFVRISLCAPVEKFEEVIKRLG